MTDPSRFERDARIMARIAAGESAAERELVDRHFPMMYGLACRMLIDHAEAEDVCQDAFLRLWRAAEGWTATAGIATWLYRVVYNLCIDHLRRRQRLVDEGAVRMEDFVDDGKGHAEACHDAQAADIVNAEILKLPPRQRIAITLVHHYELGNAEAADVMSITVEALESLLARGRRQLRDRLFGLRKDLI